MRHGFWSLLAVLSMVGCRSGQQDAAAGGSTVGATTVTRSETTRASADSTPVQASNEATVTLDRASYTAGATVTMTVKSASRDTLGYNQCSSRSVERQQGSAWVAVAEPDRMCTMELRLLLPNETQTAKTDLPATLAPGTYRIVLTLGRQTTAGGSVRAVSSTFRVG